MRLAGLEKGGFYPYPPHIAVGATFKVALLPDSPHLHREHAGGCSSSRRLIHHQHLIPIMVDHLHRHLPGFWFLKGIAGG